MTKPKKYDFRVEQINKTWKAEITRRVSSKKTHVSKSKDDFTSELEAKEWGEKELTNFLQNLKERNKRRSN